MEDLKAGFKKIFSLLDGKTSYFVTIIGLFVNHVVFDKQLTCLTKPGVNPKDLPTQYECNVYIAVPPFILFFLILWLDGEFQQVWTIVYRCGTDFWQRLLSALFKATAIGLLWVVSVLLDGDWYACQNREELLGLNTNGTYTDQLKRKSVVIGLEATLGLVFLVAIFNAVPYWCYPCRCCERTEVSRTEDKKCCSNCCDTLCRSYHWVLFEENVLIEMENIIQTDVKTTARDYVVLKGKDLLKTTSNQDPGDQGNQTPAIRVVNVDNLDFAKINHLPFNIMKSVYEMKKRVNSDSYEMQQIQSESQPLNEGERTSDQNPDQSNPTRE